MDCGLDLPAAAYRDAIDAWKEAVCETDSDNRPAHAAPLSDKEDAP